MFLALVIGSVSAKVDEYQTADVGNKGLVTNATWNYGNITFSGGDDNSYITIVNTTSNNVDYNIVDNSTFSFWIYLNGYQTTNNWIISKGNTNNFNYGFYVTSARYLTGAFYRPSGATTCSVNSLNTIPLNSWQHFVVMLNTTNCTMWQNGTLVRTSARNISIEMGSTNSKVMFGARQDGNGVGLNGSLTEYRMYERVLNDSEIGEINMSGINKNTSLPTDSLSYYISFTDAGSVNVYNENLVNISYIKSSLYNSNKITNTITTYDIYSDIVSYNNTNFTINNEVLRLYSNTDYFAVLNITNTTYAHMSNATIYSYTGSAYYSNLSLIHPNGRSYVYMNVSKLDVRNSDIKYLGYLNVNSLNNLRLAGFSCDECSNSIITNSNFSFNIRAPYLINSDNFTFTNNYLFNNTGNGSSTPTGVTFYSSSNLYIYNNTAFNIYSGGGWDPDDSPALYVSINSCNNITFLNNTIYNAETGITTYSNVYNVTIENNTIYNILGSGIKIEDYNKNVTLKNNYIHHCGSTGHGATVREGIELNGLAPNNELFDIYVYNNTIHDCVFSIYPNDIYNLSIHDNNILNVTGTRSPSIVEDGAIIISVASDVSIYNNSIGNISRLKTYHFKNITNLYYDFESYNYNNRSFRFRNVTNFNLKTEQNYVMNASTIFDDVQYNDYLPFNIKESSKFTGNINISINSTNTTPNTKLILDVLPVNNNSVFRITFISRRKTAFQNCCRRM